MTEKLTVINERVDDTPLLLAHTERMEISKLLDESFPTHGNWQRLSLGWVAAIWLSHILCEGDHRMNHVQSWAAKRLETLNTCTGQLVRALDLTDDRLSIQKYDIISADSPITIEGGRGYDPFGRVLQRAGRQRY